MRSHSADLGTSHHSAHGHRVRHRRSLRASSLVPETLNPATWFQLWKSYRRARRLGYDPFTAWRAAKKS